MNVKMAISIIVKTSWIVRTQKVVIIVKRKSKLKIVIVGMLCYFILFFIGILCYYCYFDETTMLVPQVE